MELLAPAGSKDAFYAAVQNGANAVYIGGKRFSARQSADNFELHEIKEIVRYAHLYGVKVYITINTIIASEEFDDFMQYAYDLYSIDVNALIIQDLGAAYALKTTLPEMSLHASTQMSTNNKFGMHFLKSMGFSRIVLARELSIDNIKALCQEEILPVEVFIHGALCVSYSGQCLMSSMIGGRSGNRGRCAQPCRLPYTLIDQKKDEIKKGYLLSPRDLQMIEHIPLLKNAGVDALKVEGRMKRPEYVAVVTRNYRQILDKLQEQEENKMEACSIAEESLIELRQIFNRDFTTGYYLYAPGEHLMSYQRPNNRGINIGRVSAFNYRTGEVFIQLERKLSINDGYEIWVTKGGRIPGKIKSLYKDGHKIDSADGGVVSFRLENGHPYPGDRVFKNLDAALINSARKTFANIYGTRKCPLDVVFIARIGQKPLIKAFDELGNNAEVQGNCIVEKANKQPLTVELLKKQLGRLGNTIFYLRNITLEGDEQILVPLSELNELRRKAVRTIEDERIKVYTKPYFAPEIFEERKKQFFEKNGFSKRNSAGEKKLRLAVAVGDMSSLRNAVKGGASTIYFGGISLQSKKGILCEDYQDAISICHDKGVEAVLVLPRVANQQQIEQVKKMLETGQAAKMNACLAGNPGMIELASIMGVKKIYGDYFINAYNDFTIKILNRNGLSRLAVSPELTMEQIGNLNKPPDLSFECIVHGRLELMITEHCMPGIVSGLKDNKSTCSMPCKNRVYALRDRMNMCFPIECDENCRTHIYNTKTLNMLEAIKEMAENGVEVLRIEGTREDESWVKRVTEIYSDELWRYSENQTKYKPSEKSCKELQQTSNEGFTTGHYYRGVL